VVVVCVSLLLICSTAAALIAPLVRAALNPLAQHRIPRGCVLNVNVPALPRALLKGYFITHQGNSSVVPKVEAVLSPPHSITSAVTRAVQLGASSVVA
jgi:broad specificity polyphosphatase/5'/3'-nucleotidase SurE